MKEDLQRVKSLCKEACDDIYIKYDVDLSYDHYDGEVQSFYLFQSDHTNNQVVFYMLAPLEEKIKNINKIWRVGILYNNLQKWEADAETSKVKNKEL